MSVIKCKSEILVNTTTTNSQSNPSIAALRDGGFVVVWQDLSSGMRKIRAQIYYPDGSQKGAEFDEQVGPDRFVSNTDPAVIGLTNSGFVVARSADYNG